MEEQRIKKDKNSDELDSRMESLVSLCAQHYFKQISTKMPRKHFLSDFRVRKDKRVDGVSFTVKRGRQTIVRYDPDWLAAAKLTNGVINPSESIDDILKQIVSEMG